MLKKLFGGAGEILRAMSHAQVSLLRSGDMIEGMEIKGFFTAQCYGPDGKMKWDNFFPNLVTTVGKNHALDNWLAGSSYSVTGPYLGLISNVSWSAVAAGDTMSSHSGWTEAGNANAPTYTSPRKTMAWSSASSGSKALSSNLSFAITSGTNVIIKGAFMVLGSGAVSTIDNTSGTLASAGTFTGGDKTVSNGDTLTVSYSMSM